MVLFSFDNLFSGLTIIKVIFDSQQGDYSNLRKWFFFDSS